MPVESPNELIAHPDVVMLDLAADSRDAVLAELHGELGKQPGVTDAARFLRDIMERVTVASVCIAADVALPHARTNAVSRIVIGVGRVVVPGVAFDAEHPNVRLMFMIGTPRKQVEDYLRLVAAITRLLRTEGARAALLAAPDEDQFRALLSRSSAK